MRVLLVEDDELLGDGVKNGLSIKGITVDWVTDGKKAETAIKSESFDVVILDLGLPKMSGLEVLREVRDEGIKTPILILTARDTTEDRVLGLNSGADDYLIKPFDLTELIARIRALTRRSAGRAETILNYRDIEINPPAHTVKVMGELVSLPRREFALLQKLLENHGQVLSRQQLMQSVYGWEEEVDSNALEVHIHNLRKKFDFDFIKTIRGVGYMAEKEKPE